MAGVRATSEVISGKYVFEVTIVEGMTRVGWGASFGSLELGTDERSYGYGCTGKKCWNGKYTQYGVEFGEGDVVSCMLNMNERTIAFAVNGQEQGEAFKLADNSGLRPFVCGKNFHAECNFGAGSSANEGALEFPWVTGDAFEEGQDGVVVYEPLNALVAEDAKKSGEVTGIRKPLAIILEPTRELAEQTYKWMLKFAKYLTDPELRMALLVGGGGASDSHAEKQLSLGCDIVVGTLSKIMDCIRRGMLAVDRVKFFVLDEADDLQKKDDRKELVLLNTGIKRSRTDHVQTMLFSATLHSDAIRDLIEQITDRPQSVDHKGKFSVRRPCTTASSRWTQRRNCRSATWKWQCMRGIGVQCAKMTECTSAPLCQTLTTASRMPRRNHSLSNSRNPSWW